MRKTIKYILNHKLLWPILILGFFVNMSFYLPARNSMGHDVFWHLALIRTAFDSFPFQMPIFSGVPLQGYNWLLDFFMFLISKIGLSPIFIYSVFFPLFYFISLVILIIYFGIKTKRNPPYITSLLFFTLLATPFAYLLSFYKRGTIFNGFNYPTAMQSSTALTNPQYAATILLIMLVLIILQNKKLTHGNNFIIYLSLFFAFGFKFYGGVVLSLLILIDSVFRFWLHSKKIGFARMISIIKSIILLTFAVGLSLLIFYDPLSSVKTGSIFVWSPLSLIHPLIEDPDAIYIPTLVNARYFLYENNIFSPRLWAIELFTIGLYIIYNAGTRIIGCFYLLKSAVQKKLSDFDVMIFITAVISFILTLTLIQKGEWWNTVQFFGYSLFLLNFFAAETMSRIRFKIVVIFIIILSLPLSLELLIRQKERLNAPNEITKNEQQALSYLEKQSPGIVQQLPIPKSSLITAMTGKKTYFSDEQIIKNLGVNFEKRKKQLENIEKLDINNLPVDYIYLNKTDPAYEIIINKIRESKNCKIIFENQEVIIFQKK